MMAVHGDERAALMHKLLHTLWTVQIDDAEQRGDPHLARDLRQHMQVRMPSLGQVIAQNHADDLLAAHGLDRQGWRRE